MPRLQLDHLVYAAPTLEEGREAVAAALGVDVPYGGRHEGMATHNRLMGLGGDCYFEIIAPEAGEVAERPPLFGLAEPPAAPHLITFVLRADDLAGAVAALPAAFAEALGPPMAMARGALRWTITQPADGGLPMGGPLPTLIAWPDGAGPAAALPDRGVRLERLAVRHPDAAALAHAFAPLLDDPRIVFEAAPSPSLAAAFATPAGRRTLD